jgi:hypothetical protein
MVQQAYPMRTGLYFGIMQSYGGYHRSANVVKSYSGYHSSAMQKVLVKCRLTQVGLALIRTKNQKVRFFGHEKKPEFWMSKKAQMK